MESRRNGPQLSSRHDDDDDETMLETLSETRDANTCLVGSGPVRSGPSSGIWP